MKAEWNSLAIGVNGYVFAKRLSMCVHDAELIHKTIKNSTDGHHELVINPTCEELRSAITRFEQRGRSCLRNVLYFAGHSYQHEGYLFMRGCDSNELAHDFCVDGISSTLHEASVLICLLNGCRIRAADVI